MTKEEYLDWLKTRGEAGTWGPEKCREADALIKRTTLENLEQVLKKEIPNKTIQQFTHDMLRLHFGSVEVDQLCMKLGVYPSWMEGME